MTWETITPLCAPDLARRNRLMSPDDLRNHRLLHVMGYQEGWGIWLNAAGATVVDPGLGLHLDSSLTAFELAAQGGGVALGRNSVAAALRASGRLAAPFELEVPIDEAFYLLKPLDGHSHADAAVFPDWLLAMADQPHFE